MDIKLTDYVPLLYVLCVYIICMVHLYLHLFATKPEKRGITEICVVSVMMTVIFGTVGYLSLPGAEVWLKVVALVMFSIILYFWIIPMIRFVAPAAAPKAEPKAELKAKGSFMERFYDYCKEHVKAIKGD